MRDTLHTIRTFAVYLLPASLLATAGALLIALLYYPTPQAAPVTQSRFAVVAPHGQAEAETAFTALLADALRQLSTAREPRTPTLMYRYEHGVPMAERPVLPRATPPMIWHGDDLDRPVLIRL